MHQLLEKTIATNDKIMHLAGSMQWDQILTLSHQRDDYLRQYFKISPLPDEKSVISQVIVDMTSSDQQVSKLISSRKSELIDEGLSLKNSHNAILRYRSTQTG